MRPVQLRFTLHQRRRRDLRHMDASPLNSAFSKCWNNQQRYVSITPTFGAQTRDKANLTGITLPIKTSSKIEKRRYPLI